jgi:hypothetical protein
MELIIFKDTTPKMVWKKKRALQNAIKKFSNGPKNQIMFEISLAFLGPLKLQSASDSPSVFPHSSWLICEGEHPVLRVELHHS